MLEGRNIGKSYGKVEVLRGLNVTLDHKEILFITGMSGTGKSTLLHILGTLDHPNCGGVFVGEQRLHALGKNQLARFRNRNMGFVFQFHNLLAEFTALENVCLPGFVGNRSHREVRAKGKEILDSFGLGQRLHHKPSQLSGGEMQRIAFARAIINDPDYVFADEPSGNLDSKNASLLNELILRLRDKVGMAFLIVSHSESMRKIADRTLTLIDGQLS